MVLAPPPDFNLLLSTDRILKFEPLLKDTKLFGDKDTEVNEGGDNTSERSGKCTTSTEYPVESNKDSTESESKNGNTEKVQLLPQKTIKERNECIYPEENQQDFENQSISVGDSKATVNKQSKGVFDRIRSEDKSSKTVNQGVVPSIESSSKSDTNSDRIKRKISNNLIRIDDSCKELQNTILSQNQDIICESEEKNESFGRDQISGVGVETTPHQDDNLQSQSKEKTKRIMLKDTSQDTIKPPAIQLQNSLDFEDIQPRKRCSPTMVSKDKPMKFYSRYSSSQESLGSRNSSMSSIGYEIKRNSSPEVLSIEKTSSGSPQFLSKSMTNLSYRKMLSEDENHHSRKRLSNFFSSRNSIHEGDHNNGLRTESHWPKPRTPSLFRRFSMKTPQSTEHAQSYINVIVPEVNILDDSESSTNNGGRTSGKGIFRNLSFRSATRLNLENLQEDAVHSLKPPPPQAKSFPGLKSPFSRSKFERNTAEMRKRVYDEMLKSIQDGDCKRLKLLLKRRRTDINTLEHNHSLIHEAAYKGCMKCVKALIKSGWSVNLSDEAGWKPIHSAVFGEDLETVKCLLQKDVDVNIITIDGYTPLHFAIYNDDLYTTYELIQHGADPQFQSKHEIATPFQLAINLKRTTILDYLLMLACFRSV
ncbi:uncharacterized protein [Clytia hemisphaerica]|uniref:Uncharacterized protein n=1 Tax=Clytia hemisphaerica TaxID=252671 RepID=A0A7M5VGX4_9CNID